MPIRGQRPPPSPFCPGWCPRQGSARCSLYVGGKDLSVIGPMAALPSLAPRTTQRDRCRQNDLHQAQIRLPRAKTTTHPTSTRKTETAKSTSFLSSFILAPNRGGRRKKIER